MITAKTQAWMRIINHRKHIERLIRVGHPHQDLIDTLAYTKAAELSAMTAATDEASKIAAV